ncbi:MAG: phage major capsid protein [Nitrospinae bacterium CG11_big_fil_rev_8_21_14_0_20_56_8]|nr:MAG: phage major capsid protein [Nitrospinae bacterium CG11_big_fil_rev_8_21_14_0_20_56_8]
MNHELKQLVEEINQAFLEHKSKNEQRLQELEKKGRADPVLKEQVDRIARDIQDLSEVKEKIERIETRLSRPAFEPHRRETDPQGDERRQAVLKYIRKGDSALTAGEAKLLSSDSDPDGGYWVTSSLSAQVIQKVYETSPMRKQVTVETISSDALEIPEDLNEAVAGWTSERAARTETDTPQIGLRRIPVHELYAEPRATQTLLDDARIDVESWLAQKISDKISRLENTAFISGDGAGKPRGILTHPAGTSAGQVCQVNSGHASQLTSDGLRALFYALKTPYLNRARWVMSRSSLEAISKLKDSQGNYLWQPGLQFGEPQTLLGHPVERMEDMPAVAANSLSVAFGDWQRAYTIVDRMGIRVLRDPFSAKPFVLFYTTKRTGGDVADFEAFVIQKTAA